VGVGRPHGGHRLSAPELLVLPARRPDGLEVADHIGIDHIMIESDYPHEDSTWPDTQALVKEQLAPLSPGAVDKVTHLNAAKLYRHEL
jgi:predicted TIM-barrel fold metal-dependent hydrolase